MSLDVYLKNPGASRPAGSGIWIRENGQTREITREEWDEKYPGQEPVVYQWTDDANSVVFSANITHNLGQMAGAAGIYHACWRPEEIGVTKAWQLIPLLTQGIANLQDEPEHHKKFNPKNGWGDYDCFVAWVHQYLKACEKNPNAEVEVSR